MSRGRSCDTTVIELNNVNISLGGCSKPSVARQPLAAIGNSASYTHQEGYR